MAVCPPLPPAVVLGLEVQVELFRSVFLGAWHAFFVAAPFILVGLFLAGVLHVVLSRELIARWMGQTGLMAVAAAACFGIPLPLCSCSVVPVAIELGRKGASRPARLSFLITTPESGADSILLTWGMLGPVMALVRPLASFVTAVVAGVLAIAIPDETAPSVADDAAADPESGEGGEVIGIGGLWASVVAYTQARRRRLRQSTGTVPEQALPDLSGAVPLSVVVGHVFRYGFVDLLDDIAPWLVVALLLTGVISVLVPNDLAAYGLGSGIVPMLLLLLAGIPLYICASASTPVAAALVAKGVSPGAALVFLLSGPATNASSIVLLTRHCGLRFVRIYLISIALASLACGIALDLLLAATGWKVTATLSPSLADDSGFLQALSGLLLLGLMVWRLSRGAARQAWHDGVDNLENALTLAANWASGGGQVSWKAMRLRLARFTLAVAVGAYVLSGVAIVPPDSLGYGFLCGRLVWRDLAPGLHYVPPPPFGRADVWRVGYPRKTDVGFRTDVGLIARGAGRMLVSPDEWHSPIAAMNPQPQENAYISGDENLLEMSFTVHYRLSDPYAFLYRLDHREDLVSLSAQSVAREIVAHQPLDELLTAKREQTERFIAEQLQQRLDAVGIGVKVESIHIVDLHPPQDTVFAFRDVSSAREERETRIHTARATLERELPRARGQAALDVATAEAAAATARTVAGGQATSFQAQAEAEAVNPAIVRDLLSLESAERVLPGREKFIVSPDSSPGALVFWRDQPVIPPLGKESQ